MTQSEVWYDYTNQAWVRNGLYASCSHPFSMQCLCYGRIHAGEIAPTENHLVVFMAANDAAMKRYLKEANIGG